MFTTNAKMKCAETVDELHYRVNEDLVSPRTSMASAYYLPVQHNLNESHHNMESDDLIRNLLQTCVLRLGNRKLP